jgi:hypothetical protein
MADVDDVRFGGRIHLAANTVKAAEPMKSSIHLNFTRESVTNEQ